MPLFTDPDKALPRLYPRSWRQEQSFPEAERFYKNALKLPVWAFPDEEPTVDLYIEGIIKVASVVRDSPELLFSVENGQII